MTESADRGKLPFGALIVEYDEACNALLQAEREESAARNIATDARNRVNTLQKKIRDRAEEMYKGAPSGTDWHAAQNRKRVTE